jgi:hypothetical protein
LNLDFVRYLFFTISISPCYSFLTAFVQPGPDTELRPPETGVMFICVLILSFSADKGEFIEFKIKLPRAIEGWYKSSKNLEKCHNDW